jgi:hypothetical protein
VEEAELVQVACQYKFAGAQLLNFVFFIFFWCLIDRALQYITICRAGSGYVDRNVVVSNSGPHRNAEGEMRGHWTGISRHQTSGLASGPPA